jgi:hypothetical protein
MKAYKFFDEPNKPVTDGNTGLLLLKFDEKGEYITLDERLYKRMAPHFKHEEIELVEVKTGDDAQIPCPHCDFVTTSKIGLTAHIRAKHKEV